MLIILNITNNKESGNMLTEREAELAFKSYLHSSEDQIPQYINEIEELLGSTLGFRTRLIFIEELGKISKKVPSSIEVVTEKECAILALEGIVGAYRSNSLPSEKILALPHGAKSLHNLADVLFLTLEEKRAECWREAFQDPRIYVPDIDIRKVIEEAKKRKYDKPTI